MISQRDAIPFLINIVGFPPIISLSMDLFNRVRNGFPVGTEKGSETREAFHLKKLRTIAITATIKLAMATAARIQFGSLYQGFSFT